MEYTVRIAGTPCEVRVSGGTLAEACALLGHPLELVCGGNGRCGKCDVLVERRGVRETVRACITPVTEDITVFLEVSENASAQILTSGGAHDVFAPAVTKAVLSPAEREPEHCGAYLRGVSLAAARQFSRAHRDAEEDSLTFIRHEDTLLGVQRGDTAQRLYGAAVDIGTTTVAMYIYDLTTGALLHTGSALNGQIRYGADVIARIQHAIEHECGLAELNRAILDTIDALLAAASNAVPGLSDDLWQLVFCGNSTMQHLFLGIDPSALGAEPFASVTADTVRAPAGEIGLKNCPAGALVEFLPLLGGFVGADTTAVLLGVPEGPPGGTDPRRAVQDVLMLCAQRGFGGVMLDVEPPPTPYLARLIALLDESLARRGLGLMLPEAYANYAQRAKLCLSSAISGGSLRRRACAG